MADEPEILDIEQVAGLLGVSVRTVQRHIADNKGNFPGRKIGSKWVFDRRQIIEWLRGEWQPPRSRLTQEELIEIEARRWGVDLPETLIELQRHAVTKAAMHERSRKDEEGSQKYKEGSQKDEERSQKDEE